MNTLARSRGVLGWFVALGALASLLPQCALAQAAAAAQPATATVVMLSDLHLDPFHDPAKLPLLLKAPLEDWEAILSSAQSPTQAADSAAVQKACGGSRQMDSSYALLRSSLRAARAQAPDARFVVVSGDLLVHNLDCRYRAALKLSQAAGDDQSLSAAFAEKTTVFVMKQVEAAFKGIPVYLALGNNDSRCNHNRLDVRDDYLKATVQAMLDGLVGVSAEERTLALETYQSAGYYAVTMSAPMERTRLLVIDDTYMMANFANCEADGADRKGAQEQLTWLARELDGARQRGENVWLVGHLPPSVNPRSSPGRLLRLCTDGSAETFLSSNALANLLSSHADMVRLAIFGHTHMDELHLLGGKAGVPVKVVASVTPVDGNLPSFLLGKVAPSSATLLDYQVYVASNTTGVGTRWAREYGFDETYHEASFTAASLGDLIGRLRADTAGSSAESEAYQKHFYKGADGFALGPFWQAYVCSLDQPTAEGFKTCVCGGK
jgi:sphingomyelin phosphodiesterase acid-like 3